MAALADVVKAGKARFVGASNLQAWELAKAQLIAQKQGWPGFSAIQPHYNLIYREDERDLIPFCNDQGIVLLPWSPLARGRLARVAAAYASSRSGTDGVAGHLYGDAGNDAAIYDALAEIAAETGEAPATVALAWLQAKGTFPIVGATSPAHIDAAVRAAALRLSPEQQARLEAPYTARKPAHLPSVTTKKPVLSGASR
jgi:aryl-alcohol dehydrogenase-like predicted oxidoreductase